MPYQPKWDAIFLRQVFTNQRQLMTLYEFTALTSDQQLAIVWEQSQFLALRHEAGQRIGLYTMGTFFVEVFYDPAMNIIIRHRIFVTDKLLLPYVPTQLLSQLLAG